jgi:hypothetical protein
MSDDDDAFEFEAKIQRGNGTDDRDTFKAKVSADTIDELDDKVAQVRERIEEYAAEFRQIQPQETRTLADDQATLAANGGGDRD